ncbi:MAG: cellulose synthase [Marmoricola sp.]|nr:cellulose synthase [Marmoricola sp.]
MNSDSSVWTAIAIVLTALGATWTYIAWQKRGLAAAIRGVGWTLIPIAAWMTHTLRLLANISSDVSSWAAGLVFSPVVWLGIVVAGMSAVLFGVSGQMKKRAIGTRSATAGADNPGKAARTPKQVSRKHTSDDGMDDIDAILKKHGIS